jgi:hypothetical protein
MEIKDEKWFDLVNLFDIHQAIKYTIWDRLYLQKDIEAYLNDRYLVEAFDEVDRNLELLDNPSKFIYLIRIRDGIRMMYQDLRIVSQNENVEEVLIDEFEIFKDSKRWLIGNNIPEPGGLDKEYFIRYYNSIYLLHYNVEIELNELIARIPLQSTKSEEINLETSINKQIESKKEFVNNYFITGGKNVIANNVESLVFEKDESFNQGFTPYDIVKTICEHFKSLIENNGLFKLIYENDKVTVRHESVPQKLFFAVSQIFCIANNIDVSPETNSGAGSVDFKFSVGFNQKITVELKYSKSNNLIDGFKLQLDAYNKAEQTDKSIYLVINVDDNSKLDDLLVLYKQEKARNANIPEIIIVDSKYKDSASKLKN